MPLRHLVFIEITDDEKVDSIRHQLNVLSKKMHGCYRFNFGNCENEANYHYFFMEFDSKESRDSYLTHPEHEKVAKEFIIPHLKRGLKSVIVFDYDKGGGQKNISGMKKSAGTLGYILIKQGQEAGVLEELVAHCEKINRAKPLMNNSVEELGKEYPYAMRIKFKPGINPVRIAEGVSF